MTVQKLNLFNWCSIKCGMYVWKSIASHVRILHRWKRGRQNGYHLGQHPIVIDYRTGYIRSHLRSPSGRVRWPSLHLSLTTVNTDTVTTDTWALVAAIDAHWIVAHFRLLWWPHRWWPTIRKHWRTALVAEQPAPLPSTIHRWDVFSSANSRSVRQTKRDLTQK